MTEEPRETLLPCIECGGTGCRFCQPTPEQALSHIRAMRVERGTVEVVPREWTAAIEVGLNRRVPYLPPEDVETLRDAAHDLGVHEWARIDKNYGEKLCALIARLEGK